MNNQSNQ